MLENSDPNLRPNFHTIRFGFSLLSWFGVTPREVEGQAGWLKHSARLVWGELAETGHPSSFLPLGGGVLPSELATATLPAEGAAISRRLPRSPRTA